MASTLRSTLSKAVAYQTVAGGAKLNPQGQMTQQEREARIAIESLQVLTGERGDEKRSRSAIRRGELYPLAKLKMRSSQVSAAPTQAEFNALQRDVEAIFKAVQRLSNLYGNADLPKP